MTTATLTTTQQPLSQRHRRFAQAIFRGATQAEAYRIAARRPVADSTAISAGNKLANSPAIVAEIQRLAGLAESDLVLNMRRRRELLADIASQESNRPPTHSERIAAIRTDAELSGELKQDTTVNVTLQQVLASLPPAISKVNP